MTQDAVARESQLDRSASSRIESGKRDITVMELGATQWTDGSTVRALKRVRGTAAAVPDAAAAAPPLQVAEQLAVRYLKTNQSVEMNFRSILSSRGVERPVVREFTQTQVNAAS